MSDGDASASPSLIRFGVFDVDTESGELRRDGVRVPLQQQPFRVLTQLLRKSGAVVTREELRRELWPNATFVDFEHGLNVAIARVREALGDHAEQPRYIETLPKRGYRFIARVDRPVQGEPDRKSARWWIHRATWATVALLAAALSVIGVAQLRRRPVLTDRDTILVADFINKTGEEIFDDTLRQALTVDLEQSPFLSVVSRERVRQTLQQMTRSAQDLVVGPVAREICQRAGAALSIDGTIARLGHSYVIDLEAVHCASGETVAHTEQEATTRERVINALGTAASRLRSRLGESRSTLQRFDWPLEQATTESLDALRAFTIAEETRAKNGDVAAEPFYQRAIILDPEFAMAYARLSAVYTNTVRPDELRRAAERAYALRQRVTERERLYVSYRHCASGLESDSDCVEPIAELWKRTYPRDWVPYQMLCNFYKFRGAYDKAVDNGVEAVRLGPETYLTYENLIDSYMALNQFDAARQYVDAAFRHHIDTAGLQASRFLLAFVARDRAAMTLASEALNRHDQDVVVAGNIESAAAAFEGHLRKARWLSHRAEQVGSVAWRQSVHAEQAVADAATGGRPDLAGVEYVFHGSGRDFIIAALLSGDRVRASIWLRASRLDELPRERRPQYFDRARVLLRILEGDGTAIEELPPPTPSELDLEIGYRSVYLRGIAYSEAGDAVGAVREFQRIIDHRGVNAVSPLYPLAFVHQAREHVRLGDVAKARQDYETFFSFWHDADSDVPILREAKAEYVALAAAAR